MKTLSELMTKLLERLAEMFPAQDYQSRLDSYLQSKPITSPADVEFWTREYDKNRERSLV